MAATLITSEICAAAVSPSKSQDHESSPMLQVMHGKLNTKDHRNAAVNAIIRMQKISCLLYTSDAADE